MPFLRSLRLPTWAPWLLVVAALPFGFIGWLGGKAASNRSQAWPIVQKVLPRLQDPQQTLELWNRNPSLHTTYPDVESFRAELRDWLPRFGTLPPQEPVEGKDAYGIGSDPFQLRVALKGQGGAWMYLAVQAPGPFGSRESLGEGITRLHFADARAELTERQKTLAARQHAALWARYRLVESQLRSEADARRLWASEPGLRRAFRAQDDLLRATAPWRKARPDLPVDLAAADRDVELQIKDSAMGRSEIVGYPGPDGLMLWVTWKDGSLDGIDPTLEAHGH